jgi:drug/metabolite transporter (DMT)-like permease
VNEDQVVDTLPSRIWHRDLPVPLLFVVGGCSLYLGAALAMMLFDRLSPAAVAWLRMLVAALILLAWRRPDRAVWRRQRPVLAACFGLVTGLMNVAIYEAIARLPLGTAVAVEFCGPVVAAWGSRSVRDVAALTLAATGVVLIAGVRLAGSRAGLLLALLAAVMWAAYIVLGKRVASAGSGVEDITVGFTLAVVLLCPLTLGMGLADPAGDGRRSGCAVHRAALCPGPGGASPSRSGSIRAAAGGSSDGRAPGPGPVAAPVGGCGHRCRRRGRCLVGIGGSGESLIGGVPR